MKWAVYFCLLFVVSQHLLIAYSSALRPPHRSSVRKRKDLYFDGVRVKQRQRPCSYSHSRCNKSVEHDQSFEDDSDDMPISDGERGKTSHVLLHATRSKEAPVKIIIQKPGEGDNGDQHGMATKAIVEAVNEATEVNAAEASKSAELNAKMKEKAEDFADEEREKEIEELESKAEQFENEARNNKELKEKEAERHSETISAIKEDGAAKVQKSRADIALVESAEEEAEGELKSGVNELKHLEGAFERKLNDNRAKKKHLETEAANEGKRIHEKIDELKNLKQEVKKAQGNCCEGAENSG